MENKKNIKRIRSLIDKNSIGDKSSSKVLKLMFGKNMPPTHSKNIVLVLDRILKYWVDEE